VTVDGVTYTSTGLEESETSITTQNTVVVAAGGELLFRAPTIVLGSGFRVESGASFEARSEAVTCPPAE
jgi:hypothetical protein